jgi:copper(I)-binding protein
MASILRPAALRRCGLPWFAALLLMAMALALAPAAWAHGSSKADLRVEHSYATPGSSESVVYFRCIRNEGDQPERLLQAHTPLAAVVELQRSLAHAASKAALAVAAIELPARSITPMRHDKGEYRLLLKGLKRPLKDGERFDLTLNFEHAGALQVQVWVQAAPAAGQEHLH